jgi:epoxyqueuosine reductase
MPPANLPDSLVPLWELAAEVGLELRGTLPTAPLAPEVMERFSRWLAEGRAGEMDYLHKASEVGGNLVDWKPWGKGVALFALPYARQGGGFRNGGRVARYALGKDYHNRIGRQLQKLGKRLRAAGFTQTFRATVDAAPVLEREWAIRGGLGWRGKNTLLIHPEHGPWVMLGELVMDVELPTWSPPPARVATCGSCTNCLDRCPTQALTSAYEIDPRLCISYLTIEAKGAIPLELRKKVGDWVFGCDICSEVCPFGDKEPDHAADWGLLPVFAELRLEDLLTISEQRFHQLFTGSPLRRTGWTGLQRNACVVLGNLQRGSKELESAAFHSAAIVRRHAVWALGEIGELDVIRRVLKVETDQEVQKEAEFAIRR